MQGTQVRGAAVRGQLKLDKLIRTKVMLIFPLLTSLKHGLEAKGLSPALLNSKSTQPQEGGELWWPIFAK